MRIILLGFRYSGKSTIGRAIAKLNNLKFIDIDEEIEKTKKQNIKKIVEKYGWKFFRELELKEYKKHLQDDNVVIACGGGFGVNEFFLKEEKKLLNVEKGIKILFEINNATLINNIKTSYIRPLLSGKNSISIDKIIEENLQIYDKRKKLYDDLHYDVKIDTSCEEFVNAVKNNTLFCVIGDPVWHSLSPIIHNTIYKTYDLKNFVYTKMEIPQKSFKKIKTILKIFNIKGSSITSPFKEEILKYVDEIDEKSKQIGAVNTILIDDNGKMHGYNTDYIGVLNALEGRADLENKKIAIFGSGGGAKSAVIACLEKTKNITLFNRTKDKNDNFARQNNIKSCSLLEFQPKDFDVIINATTVGLGTKKSILTKKQILTKQIVFDMVYNPLKTKLLQNAISKGARIIYGTDMLIYQAIMQHEIFTQHKIDDIKIVKRQIEYEMLNETHDICLVVNRKKVNEFLKNLSLAQWKNNFIELRVDYIDSLSQNVVDAIAGMICVDTIFTCRNIQNGGRFDGSLKEQKRIIKYAMSLNKFKYFDLDHSQINYWKNELNDKKKNYKIIISYHNFNKCLSYKECIKMIDDMFKNGADIAKIACKIISNKDIITMLKILDKYKKENKKIIFAPMCEDKIVRILANKYGSWTNFVCLNEKESTANGQICIDDYNKIVDLLR